MDFEYPFLEVRPAFDRAQDFVARAKHAIEELELGVEKLENALLRAVLQVEKVDDKNVDPLSITMAAADALFDALGIPGKIEINDQRTELKVDTFCARFRRDEDGLAFPERFDDRSLHVSRL